MLTRLSIHGVAVVAAALLALVPSLVNAAPPNPRLERDLVALTNVDRTSNGLVSLIENDPLIGVARERSDDMVNRNYFAHEIPPDGTLVFDLMRDRTIAYLVAGENIAWNTSAEATTVQRAQQDFMNSPLHRANILRDDYNSIGVGAVQGNPRTMYTVLFMRVADG